MSDTMTNPQDIVAAARQMLAASGAPMTAENLNRAMLAIGDPTGAPQFDMNAAIERSMAPRTAPRRAPAQQAAPSGAAPAQEPGPPQQRDTPDPMGAAERAAFEEANAEPQQVPTRGAAVAAGVAPGGRRAGTINGATRIDENDPAASMFAGQPPRQADESGVDQIGLAAALGLPFMFLGGGGAGAAGGAVAAAPRGLGVTLAPRGGAAVVEGAPQIAAQTGQIAAPAARIAGPAAAPATQGTARVGSEVGTTALPRVDGGLRQRMIDRNVAASRRNDARTQGENAAQRGTPRREMQRGAREPIYPVPNLPSNAKVVDAQFTSAGPVYRMPRVSGGRDQRGDLGAQMR